MGMILHSLCFSHQSSPFLPVTFLPGANRLVEDMQDALLFSSTT